MKKKKQQQVSRAIVPMAQKSRKTIVPPPTKAEVIEALVVAEVRARTAKSTAAREKMGVLASEIMADLRKHVGQNADKFLDLMCATMPYSVGVHDIALNAIHLKPKEISDEFAEKIVRYNQLADESRSPFIDMRMLRRRMRDAIRLDHKRVDALSKSNEVGEMLAAIHGFKPLIPNNNGHAD
jgi:hypothetical protein